MSAASRNLLSEAMSLPAEERVGLAADLLASVDMPSIGADPEWLEEISRRAKAALSGEPGIARDEAERRMRAAVAAR